MAEKNALNIILLPVKLASVSEVEWSGSWVTCRWWLLCRFESRRNYFLFLDIFFCLVFYFCLFCVCMCCFVFDHMCPLHFSRLRVVPHSSSGIVDFQNVLRRISYGVGSSLAVGRFAAKKRLAPLAKRSTCSKSTGIVERAKRVRAWKSPHATTSSPGLFP